MLEIIFWASVLLLYYIYDGYLRLLQFLILLVGKKKLKYQQTELLPSVTVLLTVYNEASGILSKIDNLLQLDYPAGRLDILVASDGSTDSTNELVDNISHPSVTLFCPEKSFGKTDTQNQAMVVARGEIVVFTDCDTRFETDFLMNIVQLFRNKEIGAATGKLLFVNDLKSHVSKSQGRYWNYELKLRRIETELNILAVASGACMAVRRSGFVPIDANVGEDCLVPLDMVLRGYKVVHVSDAIAYDQMPATVSGEFNARVRMTVRNWQGTWMRSALLNPFMHPCYALSLWSHKILRWLSPFFLIAATFSSALLASESAMYFIAFLCFVMLIAIGAASLFFIKGEVKFPAIGAITSFILANLGFLVGVLKAVTGKKIAKYNN